MYLTSILIVPFLVSLTEARAVASSSSNTAFSAEVIDYLAKYGYLTEPKTAHDTDELRSALKKLQEFAGLEQTGVVDPATTELLSKVRCGLSDKPGEAQKYTLTGSRWPGTHVTYRVRNNPPTMSGGATRNTLRRALTAWENVSPLKFREEQSNDAKIQISFENDQHSYGNGDGRFGQNVIAHGFYPSSNPLGGDVHFNKEKYRFTDRKPNSGEIALLNIAVHELGHSIGLDHSNDRGAVMYPIYNPNIALPQRDDINGVQAIYGRPQGR